MIEALKVFVAIFVAVFVPVQLTRRYEFFYFLDLSLVAVIYFATYKTRIQSSLIGSAAGLVQDSISRLPLGMNGFTKTLTGYMAAAICSRLSLETFTTQFLLLFVMSVVDSTLKLVLYRISDISLPPRFLPDSLLQAFVSAALGSVLLAGVRMLSRWKRTSR